MELSVPPERRPRGDLAIIHRIDVPAVDATVVEGISVTTVARTLIDVAGTCSREFVDDALDEALRRGLVTLPRLRWRLGELARKGRPGVALMRELIAEYADDPRTDSKFERLLFRAIKRKGLPLPIAQYHVRDNGRVVARVDFAYPLVRLAIEAEGRGPHAAKKRHERDLDRANDLMHVQWRIQYVKWHDLLRRPDVVTDSIARAIAQGAR